jgi:hypothetical protein
VGARNSGSAKPARGPRYDRGRSAARNRTRHLHRLLARGPGAKAPPAPRSRARRRGRNGRGRELQESADGRSRG